jgi:hypothetical protein
MEAFGCARVKVVRYQRSLSVADSRGAGGRFATIFSALASFSATAVVTNFARHLAGGRLH